MHFALERRLEVGLTFRAALSRLQTGAPFSRYGFNTTFPASAPLF